MLRRCLAHIQLSRHSYWSCQKCGITRLRNLNPFHRVHIVGYSTLNDEETLLEYVNRATVEDLEKFHSITRQRASDIITLRDEIGHFPSLKHIDQVYNIGSKTIERLMEEYRDRGSGGGEGPTKQLSKKYQIDKKIMQPWFNLPEIPESAVAYCLQLDAVYWVKMTKNQIVTDWNYLELGDYLIRKYNHVKHTNRLWELLRDIPDASIYMSMETVFIPPNRALTSATLNKARLDSLLMLCLNLRNSQNSVNSNQPPSQVVFKLKATEMAKYFKLLVGNEKISSQKIATDIANKQRENCFVHMNFELRERFMECRRPVREQLSDILLEVTMFYELLHAQERENEYSNMNKYENVEQS